MGRWGERERGRKREREREEEDEKRRERGFLMLRFFPLFYLRELDLRKPIYRKTACYGHFGRNEFTWEQPKKLVY